MFADYLIVLVSMPTRPRSSPPATVRARLDSEAVLGAAEAVVDRAGWDGLTMTALAAELGVRPPSLYHHVEGLDAVRAHLQQRVLTQLGAELRDAALGRSGEEGLRAIAAVYRQFALRHPERYTALTRPGPDDASYRATDAWALQAVVAVLGSFGLDDTTQQLALVPLWSAVHGFVNLELNGALPAGTDADAAYERTVDGLLHLIEIYAGPPAPTPRRTRS